jgi:hypothetical protein
MKPSKSFPEANLTMHAPPGMDNCADLPVFSHALGQYRMLVSSWQPSEEERKIIAAGGRIFLTIHGCSMPPVSLAAGIDFEHSLKQET